MPIERTAAASNSAELAARPVVEQTRVEGCLSYLLFDPDSRDAAVIDPRLDAVDALLERLRAGTLNLRYAIDTHAHADHISGISRIARETGALAIVSSDVGFAARRVRDGDRLQLGVFALEILTTPGHTEESITVRAGDAVFTGDTLLIGSAGRTDFQNGSPTALFQSFEAKLRPLSPQTVVYPGHDYRGRTHTTIGDEWRTNTLFRDRVQASFVARLSGSSQPPPANMKFVLAANHAGATGESATITPAVLRARLDAGESLSLIDVRSPPEFASSRLHGSRNVPLEQIGAAAGALPTNQSVVLVCEAGVRSQLAATAFAGRTEVMVLAGGLRAWRAAGLPTDGAGGGVWALERQVRLVAGAMVLVGAILGLTVSPWLFGVPIFFGAGLTFSGLTGTCGMGLLLAKLPWNRRAMSGGSCSSSTGGSCAVGGRPNSSSPAGR